MRFLVVLLLLFVQVLPVLVFVFSLLQLLSLLVSVLVLTNRDEYKGNSREQKTKKKCYSYANEWMQMQ